MLLDVCVLVCVAVVPPLVDRTAELNAELGTKESTQGLSSGEQKVDGVMGLLTVNTMDCYAPLPSGKSVLERFNLNPTPQHTALAFYTANGDRPLLLSPSLYTDLSPAPSRILQHLRSVMATRVHRVTSDAEAEQWCWKKKHCALLLHEGKLSNQQTQIIRTANAAHRAIHFATLDVKKHQLRPLQQRLPPLDDALWDEVNNEQERGHARLSINPITNFFVGCCLGCSVASLVVLSSSYCE